jgi:hypothetical protein
MEEMLLLANESESSIFSAAGNDTLPIQTRLP